MTSSVALCTYNGEHYIEQQIRSIYDQTMSVSEIVVCDDGSSDRTIAILEQLRDEFAIPISIHINEENLGVCRNFQKAIELCKGDIIFLSDQDDIWHPNKVETIVKWFESNPTKDVVMTDADLVDENGQYREGTLFECVGLTSINRKIWDDDDFKCLILGIANRATGATMAMRKDCKNWMFPLYCENMDVLHDYQIAYWAAERKSLGTIYEKLIQYRCHSGQTMGILDWYHNSPSVDPIKTDYYDEGLLSIIKTDYSRALHDFISFRRNNRSMTKCICAASKYILFYHCFWFQCMRRDLIRILRTVITRKQ